MTARLAVRVGAKLLLTLSPSNYGSDVICNEVRMLIEHHLQCKIADNKPIQMIRENRKLAAKRIEKINSFSSE